MKQKTEKKKLGRKRQYGEMTTLKNLLSISFEK